MNYKILGILTLGAMLAAMATAQTTDEELRVHSEFTASNYLVYPEPAANVKYTKAPAGYKAFYLSHYGRHGSRYHHSADEYKYLLETLSKADSLGKLTETGKQALAYSRVLTSEAAPRTGDLTQVGVRQHQGIAKRMAKNFPEIFNDRTVAVKNEKGTKNKKVTPHVKAYASTSGRCIVSMAAFVSEFRAQKPKTEIETFSGKSYMGFISPFDWNKLDYSRAKAYTDENGKLWAAVNPAPFMAKLFNDTAFVAKNIDAGTFYNRFFEITSLLPGMDEPLLKSIEKEAKVPAETFMNLFTTEEKITRWKAQNSWWYSLLGTSPLINVQDGINFGKGILQNILEEADTVINADTLNVALSDGETPVAATLRFGHDTGLLPLAALMQLPLANAKVSDLSKLHEQWTDFRVIPMAANMQIVFYKSTKPAAKSAANAKNATASKTASKAAKGVAAKAAPILVKLLYNEVEQTLPIPCGFAESTQSIANATTATAQSEARNADGAATTATATTATAQAADKDCPAAPYYRWEDFKAFYTNLLK